MSKLLKYYQILGVKDGAGLTEITSSYRRLCRLYHPDVSRDPKSDEKMKDINLAYSILRDSLVKRFVPATLRQHREHTGPASDAASEWEAYSTLSGYFDAISRGDYGRAFGFISDYDKQYVTSQSFSRWRKSIARLFLMRGFTIRGGSRGTDIVVEGGSALKVRKFRVNVVEKNIATSKTAQSDVTKLTVRENGAWRVFLGYKDLREIARVFEELFEEKRKSEIIKNWEEYYDGLCPGLRLLSVNGVMKEAGREMYRQRRYGGKLTFAALRIIAWDGASDDETEELMRCAARAVFASIRETDAVGYMGEGSFVILLSQLGGRSARVITRRLSERVRLELKKETGEEVKVRYACEQAGGETDITKVFKRLCKNE